MAPDQVQPRNSSTLSPSCRLPAPRTTTRSPCLSAPLTATCRLSPSRLVTVRVTVNNAGLLPQPLALALNGVPAGWKIDLLGGGPGVSASRFYAGGFSFQQSTTNLDISRFYGDVLKGMKPRAQMQVDNKLADDGSKLGVELNFRSLEDFSPERVANQIEPLRKLLEARTKLSDLRNKLAGNEKLEDALAEVLSSTEKLKQLSAEALQTEQE